MPYVGPCATPVPAIACSSQATAAASTAWKIASKIIGTTARSPAKFCTRFNKNRPSRRRRRVAPPDHTEHPVRNEQHECRSAARHTKHLVKSVVRRRWFAGIRPSPSLLGLELQPAVAISGSVAAAGASQRTSHTARRAIARSPRRQGSRRPDVALPRDVGAVSFTSKGTAGGNPTS